MESDETAKGEQLRLEDRESIRARGMSFEVFLPEGIANWLREKIAAGVFKDPAEAAFVAFQDLRELDQHPSIRRELLKATIDAGVTDQSR
jgi:hypothetical protein